MTNLTDRLTAKDEHSQFWQNAHLYFDRVYQQMNLDPTWRAAVSYTHLFDATVKWASEGTVRKWPKELEMDEATKELVSKRWKEYGVG